MADQILLFLMVLSCVFLSSFFSGVETAAISSNKLRLRHMADRGDQRAHRLLRLLEYPDRVVTVILVGNNLVNITAASLFTLIWIHWIGGAAEWVAPLVLTPLLLVFGEVIPKIYCRYRADRVLLTWETPLRWTIRILSSAGGVIRYLSNVILGLFGLSAVPPQRVKVTKEELKYLLQEETKGGTLEPEERSLIARIFQFSELKVAGVMVGLDKVILLPAQATVQDLKEVLAKSGYSRYPIYDGKTNNIIGVIHILDVLFESDGNLPLRPFLRPAHFIHMETPASTALVILQSHKQPMAVVVSRSHGPEGIVTIEDLVEQIVGEL